MKKIVVLFCVLFVFNVFSPGQYDGSWVLPVTENLLTKAKEFQFNQGAITTNTLITVSEDQYQFSLGGYSQEGNLLFYVLGNGVYQAGNNQFVDYFNSFSEDDLEPEVQVINLPGSNDHFYIIYSAYVYADGGPEDYGGFFYSEVFVDLISGNVSLGNTEVAIPFISSWSNGGFAISKLLNGSTKDLYRCSAHGITVNSIDDTGILNDTEVLLPGNDIGLGHPSNGIAWNFELLEKGNGDKVFAWSTMYAGTNNKKGKVLVYILPATGSAILKIIDPDPNSTGEIAGLEFSYLIENIIYASYNSSTTGSGIIAVDYVNETTTVIVSDDYSHTFLQHAPDGNIYGVSNNGQYFCQIADASNGAFYPGYFNLNELLSYILRSDEHYFILPENEDVPLQLATAHKDVSCDGYMDGWASAGAQGGVPPYSYVWTNSTGQVVGTTPDLDPIGTGLYTCCVTDSDYPATEICQTVQISVNYDLLPFDFPDEIRLVEYNPANTVTNWSSLQASGFYEIGIRIESGQTLNIASGSYLEFHMDAKIIVEPGATLNINGSTLTNYAGCPLRWKGIEVWGNYSESQLVDPANGIQYQGKLIMDETVIEHAKIAVNLTNPVLWLESNGGIVQAENSTFRNNQRAFHTMKYENTHPVTGKPMDNLSYFKYCNFAIDNQYMAEVVFYKHVDMVETDGIKFKACNFTLSPEAPGVSYWNQAIAAYNAGFDVSGLCVVYPCSSGDPSTFIGFYRGIMATNSGINNYTFSVGLSEFTNNAIGIYAIGIDYLSVLFSTFHVGYNASDQEACEGESKEASGIGIDLNHCTGFAIEENMFSKTPGSPVGTYTGIRIAETQATDQIYKNTFDGLSYGNYAVGQNWITGWTWAGLAYFCNENTGNWRDIEVAPGDPSGVQSEIGSTELPAGNTFTTNADNNFNNLGDHEVGYFYYTGNPPEYPEIVYHVAREPVGIQNQCPSHYGGGGSGGGTGRGLVLLPGEKQDAELEFANNLSDYNNVKALYDNLKDGGNTEATLSEIETSWPNDMWELRAKLLGDSPHLSMEVLKATADKTDVLPESVIFEIMAANPDELKKDELIKYLEDKENPLPEYIIDILRQVSTGTTYKTVLHRQMAHYNQVKTRAAYDIVRSILNDSIMDNDELRNWLDNIGDKRADEQIIASYLSEGNYNDATALANMMPALYDYSDEEMEEHYYYLDMLNLQVSLGQQDKSIFELDSTEVNNLVNLADHSHGTAGAQAKGILEYAYGYHFCNCIDADTSGYKNSESINYEAFNKVFGPEIDVKPNPANEWTTFNYSLPDNETDGIIKISDVSGKMIETIVVSAIQGQKVWDTRKIQPGVYFYTFSVNGISKSGKIVITK